MCFVPSFVRVISCTLRLFVCSRQRFLSETRVVFVFLGSYIFGSDGYKCVRREFSCRFLFFGYGTIRTHNVLLYAI